MSRLRPECSTGGTSYCPDTFDALHMIRDAVMRRSGLIRGALHKGGMVCAIGAFFDDNPNLALASTLVDQVAAYNDSVPATVMPSIRRNMVIEWLNNRITYLTVGIPKRTKKAAPKKKKAAHLKVVA